MWYERKTKERCKKLEVISSFLPPSFPQSPRPSVPPSSCLYLLRVPVREAPDAQQTLMGGGWRAGGRVNVWVEQETHYTNLCSQPSQHLFIPRLTDCFHVLIFLTIRARSLLPQLTPTWPTQRLTFLILLVCASPAATSSALPTSLATHNVTV